METAAAALEAQKSAVNDPKAQEAFEKQIADFKATVARYEKDPKKPEDSMDAIQDRAKEASEARELANRRLGHYELGSGLTQIAIVLASAAIITGITALVWFSVAARRDRRGADRVRVFCARGADVHRLAGIALKAASVRSPARRSRSPAR